MTKFFDLGNREIKTGDHSDLPANRPVGKSPVVIIKALQSVQGGSGGIIERVGQTNSFSNNTGEPTSNIFQGPPIPSVLLQTVMTATLPMPTSLPQEYAAEWMNDSVGLIERGIAAVAGRQGITANDLSRGDEIGSKESEGANWLVKMARSTAFRKAAQNSGFAYNPHKEMFYTGPVFRTLPMNWTFAFKNQAEYDQYYAMIEELAFYQHPEYMDGVDAGVWTLPETFEVEFKGAKLRKFGRCVLVNIQTNPMSMGFWRNHSDGSPAHVDLNLTFMELKPLTKTDIRRGF